MAASLFSMLLEIRRRNGDSRQFEWRDGECKTHPIDISKYVSLRTFEDQFLELRKNNFLRVYN
jgi:hypothetical protein